jgi:hypothetical protein
MIFQIMSNRLRLRAARVILSMTIALISPALARPGDAALPSANDLLRQAVANEKIGSREDYYAWIDRLQKPRGSVTKLMVNTPQGILARIVAFNERTLTPDERQQDDERIDRLLDPEMMREKAKKQHDDQQHVERVLYALADAFHCEYAAANDDRNLRLECSPNPKFSPPNYESQVLQGMKAVILIDRADTRISRIEGTLFKEVTFGWGFLGKLNRGGKIDITQSKVSVKHWAITSMQLAFEGRVLVVKSLKIQETETAWDYHSVPKMTVAQALEYLRNYPAKTSH